MDNTFGFESLVLENFLGNQTAMMSEETESFTSDSSNFDIFRNRQKRQVSPSASSSAETGYFSNSPNSLYGMVQRSPPAWSGGDRYGNSCSGLSPEEKHATAFLAAKRNGSEKKENGRKSILRLPGEFSTDLQAYAREMAIVEMDRVMQRSLDELNELSERTGMPITQENGQRRFGPPRDCTTPPPKGCEVFVGKIPRDCFEPELIPIFERVGKVYELRLMMDFSGTNRGYCFVQYYEPSHAQAACRELNHYEIRKGRFIGVVKSVDNCRLFVGGIPKDKTEADIHSEINRVTEGVVRVIVYPSVTDKSKNRGFAFVEYESHKSAAMARRKMIPGKIPMWGLEVCVDWAEPEPDVDSEIMRKVQVLYVRNLMMQTTEEQLKDIFNANSSDGVEKVKKLKDYAFVHFASREQAEAAKIALNEKDIDGTRVEIMWAKPVDKHVYKAQKALSRSLYSPATGANGSVGNPNFQYNNQRIQGAMHFQSYQGMAGQAVMNQMHGLPFNPQQVQMLPGMNVNFGNQRMVGGRANRGRAAAGVQGLRLPLQNAARVNQINQSRNVLPYMSAPTLLHDQLYYGVSPGLIATSSNTQQSYGTLSPHTGSVMKKSIQILIDMCLRYGWGEPIFEPMQLKEEDNVYYSCSVLIPHHPLGPKEFRSDNYFSDIEDARGVAAEGILRSLQSELNSFALQSSNAQYYDFRQVVQGAGGVPTVPVVYRQ